RLALFADPSTTPTHTLSLHDALPIWPQRRIPGGLDRPYRLRPSLRDLLARQFLSGPAPGPFRICGDRWRRPGNGLLPPGPTPFGAGDRLACHLPVSLGVE